MKHQMNSFIKLVLALILVTSLIALGACKGKTTTATTTTQKTTTTTTSTTATTTTAATPITINLVAQGMTFDKSTITVPVGATVTLIFNNKDTGILHNFALYTNSSASQSIFQGQTITGPNTITYTFTAPSTSGTYFFRCDVHPTQMTGNFIVQ